MALLFFTNFLFRHHQSFPSTTANTTWVDVNAAPEHDNYDTITLHDGLFYSLAQSLTNNSYDLIKWTPVATPSIVTSFTNAHPVKIFGHVLTQCDCHSDQFIAVVVEDHFPGITKDRFVCSKSPFPHLL